MKRLIDDPEIAGELRSEMRRYATEQAQVDLKLAYASLEESLQLRAAGAASAPEARFSTSAWSGLSGATKLLIVAAIGGSSALGGYTLLSGEHSERVPVVAQTSAERARVTQAPADSPAGSSAAAEPPSSPAEQAAEPRVQPEAAQATTPKASRSRTSSGSASRREIAQVARIKALLEQDPAAARRLIRAAQREFPSGLLVEEREGLDVIALFALDEPERARKNAERFIDRYPQSPLRPKLERLIADARE